jgi:hypothetical protein
LFYGLILDRDHNPEPQAENEGATVVGNSFINVKNSGYIRPFVLYGYKGASISSNRFRCMDASCATWPLSTAALTPPVLDNVRNVISSNVFEGFVDSGNQCPIYFDALAVNNLVVGNLFAIPDGGDGFCGPAQGQNQYFGNHAVTP